MAKQPTSIWRKLETCAIVTVITALIWLYAEGKTAKKLTLSFAVDFVPPAGAHLLIDPASTRQTERQELEVTIECAAGKLAEVQRLVQEQPIQLEVSSDPANPDPMMTVPFKDRLNAYEPLTKLGASVVSVNPATISLRVEALRPLTMSIRVVTGDGQFAIHPTPDPATAITFLPVRLGERAAALSLEARLSNLEQYEVGRPYEVPLALTLPEELRKELGRFAPPITPARTNVSFTISKQTATTRLPRVPIRAMIPPEATGRYRIAIAENPRVLPNVTVAGPSDVIQQLEQDPTNVFVMFRLKDDDLENSEPQTVNLELVGPAGVVADPPLQPLRIQVSRIKTVDSENPEVPAPPSRQP